MNRPVPAAVPEAQAVVDAVFALRGHAVARNHAQALREALAARWPWLESDPMVAIHPLRLVPGNDDPSPLSKRARLMLRLPAQRMRELAAARDVEIDLMGQVLRLGPPQQQALRPHSALYAHRVAAPGPDEASFMALVEREIDALGIAAARVCGRHQQLVLPGRRIDAFSLLLHEMTPEHALRLQQRGLGDHRLLGCGVFVPHKSAAAV